MKWLRSLLGGCRHKNLSRVFTDPKPPRESYVTCLSCGGRWLYSLRTMTRGPRIEPDRPRRWDDGIESNIGLEER